MDNKKLQLKKEVIARLNDENMININGGQESGFLSIFCPANTNNATKGGERCCAQSAVNHPLTCTWETCGETVGCEVAITRP